MIIDELITDRMESDVVRLKELIKKTWQGMTAEEKEEYRDGVFPLEDINGIWLQDSVDEQLYSQPSAQRGGYCYSDLNRVETAVAYIASALVDAPDDLEDYATSLNVAWDDYFALPYDETQYSLTTKTDWVKTDKPLTSQMQRYYNNLVLISQAFPSVGVPQINALDYQGANQIEQMLVEVWNELQEAIKERQARIRAAAECYRSGEFYSGEVY